MPLLPSESCIDTSVWFSTLDLHSECFLSALSLALLSDLAKLSTFLFLKHLAYSCLPILSQVFPFTCCCCEVTSVVSDSVRPHRRQPTRLCRPWDSPGKNTGVGCHFLLQCMKVKSESEVTQSCRTLSDLMDCSLPGSSTHGIFQARVLEWGAIAFSVTLD